MMSVLSNFSMEQAGFQPELRDRIAAAWRAEDYHKAAELIPDEMLDAFMLCGTPEEVAATLKLATEFVDPERIQACTNCGMAPMAPAVAAPQAKTEGDQA